MARFNVKYGLKTNLSSAEFEAGQVLVVVDSGEMYVDKPNGTTIADRIRIGDFNTVDNTSALSGEGIDTSKMYYIRDIKALAVYNTSKSQWEQVNADTGATAVAFTGGSGTGGVPVPTAGEAVVGASYNPATRTITFSVHKFVANDIQYVAGTGGANDITVKDALDTLNGDDTTEGSVAKALKDAEDYTDSAIAGLDTTQDVGIASKTGKAVTITGSVAESDGIVEKGSATDITLADVASTGNAEDVAIADANSKITATNVEDALEELVDAIATSTAASDVTCETNEPVSGSTLKTYSFYQGVLGTDDAAAKASKKIVDINIPRDYLVKAAEVKTVSTADEPVVGYEVGDKYIDFTINTKDSADTATHLYIAVDELMSAISGSVGAEITVAISADNVISATVNKISDTKMIDQAQVLYTAEDEEVIGGTKNVGDVKVAEKTAHQKFGDIDTDIQTINSTIAAMDADLDAALGAGDTDTEAVAVVTGVTEANGVLTAVDSVAVDAAGAATRAKAAVIGTGTGRTGSGTQVDPYVYEDTIKGTKTYAEDLINGGLTWGTF